MNADVAEGGKLRVDRVNLEGFECYAPQDRSREIMDVSTEYLEGEQGAEESSRMQHASGC